MRNEINVKELFSNNTKVIQDFLQWCKDNDELCEYDLENLALSLELGAQNVATKLFHFHKGNILDYLEEKGYRIGIFPMTSRKWVMETYYNDCFVPINHSNHVSRNEAIMQGVKYSIEHYENRGI